MNWTDRKPNVHLKNVLNAELYIIELINVQTYLNITRLVKFSSNPGKVYFDGLLHLFIYIRDNKTLGLNYYADLKDALLSDLLRQPNIETENQLMALFYYFWKYCSVTVRSIGSYMIFYQGEKIDHGTHVPGQFSQ